MYEGQQALKSHPLQSMYVGADINDNGYRSPTMIVEWSTCSRHGATTARRRNVLLPHRRPTRTSTGGSTATTTDTARDGNPTKACSLRRSTGAQGCTRGLYCSLVLCPLANRPGTGAAILTTPRNNSPDRTPARPTHLRTRMRARLTWSGCGYPAGGAFLVACQHYTSLCSLPCRTSCIKSPARVCPTPKNCEYSIVHRV